MKYKHYAPRAQVWLLKGSDVKILDFLQKKLSENKKVGILCFEEFKSKLDGEHIVDFGKRTGPGRPAEFRKQNSVRCPDRV